MNDIIKVNNFANHLKNTKLNKKKYEELYKKSINDNDIFWDEVAQRISWMKKYEKVKEEN